MRLSKHNADFEKANFVWTYGIYKAPALQAGLLLCGEFVLRQQAV